MDEVRRADDDELCGLVDRHGDRWRALTVFGAELGRHDSRTGAIAQVLAEGLASLASRWTLRDGAAGDEEEEVVCILEVHPGRVAVARGPYAVPGVPTLIITADEIADGTWELHPSA